jgi:hypothetical protein
MRCQALTIAVTLVAGDGASLSKVSTRPADGSPRVSSSSSSSSSSIYHELSAISQRLLVQHQNAQQQQHQQREPNAPPPHAPPSTMTPADVDATTYDDSVAMTYDAYGGDEGEGEELDDAALDGHLYEDTLKDELDVDDERHEPILKTAVVLVALAMLFMGWRMHCSSNASAGDAYSGVGGGRHLPFPFDASDDLDLDDFGDSTRRHRADAPPRRTADAQDVVSVVPMLRTHWDIE